LGIPQAASKAATGASRLVTGDTQAMGASLQQTGAGIKQTAVQDYNQAGAGAQRLASGQVGAGELADATGRGLMTGIMVMSPMKGVGAVSTETKIAEAVDANVAKAATVPEQSAKATTYQTYTKTNPDTGEVYTGRTSGTGTPEENVKARDQGHHMNDKGFGPAELDKSSSNPDAIRGREQQMIDANGGAKRGGGTSGNEIRGVSKTNKKAEQYKQAATKEFGGS